MPTLSVDKQGKVIVSERQVQKACVDLLLAHGWLVFETHTDARKSMGERGQPDLVALRRMSSWSPVRVLLIEVKRRDGRVSEAQKEWHEMSAAKGFRVLVIRDVKELEAHIA